MIETQRFGVETRDELNVVELNGGFHRARGDHREYNVETGLRVRPPPSLLRGLQAPSGSLSPPGGAALR